MAFWVSMPMSDTCRTFDGLNICPRCITCYIEVRLCKDVAVFSWNACHSDFGVFPGIACTASFGIYIHTRCISEMFVVCTSLFHDTHKLCMSQYCTCQRYGQIFWLSRCRFMNNVLDLNSRAKENTN